MRNGKKVDDHIHWPILDDPESDAINLREYKKTLKREGFSEREIALLTNEFPTGSDGGSSPPDGGSPPPDGFARGGPGSAPWNVRKSSHPRQPAGMIKSDVPGRTDKLPMSVPQGSYIIPADIPSALGQGNTMAGDKILGSMLQANKDTLKSGPYGSAARAPFGKLKKAKAGNSGLQATRTPKGMGRMKKFADGGETEDIPIIAAGGEYVVHPDQVAGVGNGDVEAGHKVLDKLVLNIRKRHIETLKKLKPPKR